MREVIVRGVPHIGAGLEDALTALEFPAAFIDFETSNPAFPVYPGTRPYQQVCFQWSSHEMASSDALPLHSEFLAGDTNDPRVEFCRSLWEVIELSKTIVHYSAFELTALRQMVSDGIPLAKEILEALESRSWDLHTVIRDHVYFEGFNGRTSIKVVLPTLVPTMTYKGLLIGDGQAAGAGFRQMIDLSTSPEKQAELRDALLKYCEQDTLAMVEIYRVLRQLSVQTPKAKLI